MNLESHKVIVLNIIEIRFFLILLKKKIILNLITKYKLNRIK